MGRTLMISLSTKNDTFLCARLITGRPGRSVIIKKTNYELRR